MPSESLKHCLCIASPTLQCLSRTCSRIACTTGVLQPMYLTMSIIHCTRLQATPKSTLVWPHFSSANLEISAFIGRSVALDLQDQRSARFQCPQATLWPACSISFHAPITPMKSGPGFPSVLWPNACLQAFLLWLEHTKWSFGLWASIGTTGKNLKSTQEVAVPSFLSFFEKSVKFPQWICINSMQ